MAAGAIYGIGAGTDSLSGTALTYTVTTPATEAAGLPMHISFTGLTNTSTAGSYTSLITAEAGAAPEGHGHDGGSDLRFLIDRGDGDRGPDVDLANNTLVLPGSPTDIAERHFQSLAVVLTVQTNPASGYTVRGPPTPACGGSPGL